MTKAWKQANFLLPDDLIQDLKKTVPVRQRDKFVSAAIRKELKRIKLKKALKTSFGAWKDKDHPNLKSGTDAYIRRTRRSTSAKKD